MQKIQIQEAVAEKRAPSLCTRYAVFFEILNESNLSQRRSRATSRAEMNKFEKFGTGRRMWRRVDRRAKGRENMQPNISTWYIREHQNAGPIDGACSLSRASRCRILLIYDDASQCCNTKSEHVSSYVKVMMRREQLGRVHHDSLTDMP